MSEIDWVKIGEGLRAPFPAKQVAAFVGRGNKTYHYVKAEDGMNRLDSVVGPGAWSTTYKLIDPATCVVECTLSIHGVSKADVGYPNNSPGSGGGSGEPLKDAYTDAFRRAGCQWGIARYLYQGLGPTPPSPQSTNAAQNGEPQDGMSFTHNGQGQPVAMAHQGSVNDPPSEEQKQRYGAALSEWGAARGKNEPVRYLNQLARELVGLPRQGDPLSAVKLVEALARVELETKKLRPSQQPARQPAAVAEEF